MVKKIGFTLFAILLIVSSAYLILFFIEDSKELYGSPLIEFNDLKEITGKKQINEGYSIAAQEAKKWNEDSYLGKIEIKYDVDILENNYRSIIRYVFQYEDKENDKRIDFCDKDFYLYEIILTPDAKNLLKNRNWHTKGCYSSGTGPEICKGKLKDTNFNDTYNKAILTALEYVKDIILKDSSFHVISAILEPIASGLPESWDIRLANKCWKTDKKCPSVMMTMNISKDGEKILAAFLSGTPDYIKKWKKLEYLNPDRPVIKK